MSEQQTINERIVSIFGDDSVRLKLKAKTVLLAEGQVPKKLFFIESGGVRAWFHNKGEETTFQFAFEDQLLASFESLCSNQPSWYTIQTIEPSIIHCITKEKFERQMTEKPEIKEWFDEYAYKRLFHYQKLFVSRIRDNPEKRYQELVEKFPHIVLRVPQHYIASYLGITAVSLSRIRNRKNGIS